MACSTVMAGAVSACFMLRLMVCASLKACSSFWILFQRRVLMLTVTRLGVLSIIASISIRILLQSYNNPYKHFLLPICVRL